MARKEQSGLGDELFGTRLGETRETAGPAKRGPGAEAASRNRITSERKGGDLFIVDNSVSGWTGLRYLEEWTQIAKSFDIATVYFEIGSLLELDGKWQTLEKIRILMGAETTHRTRKALLEAVKARAEEGLDSSLEVEKEANPFPTG